MQGSLALEIQQVFPEIILSVFGIAIILLDTFLPKSERHIATAVALIGVVVTAVFTLALVGEDGTSFSGMIVVDNFSIFFRFTFLIIGGLTILASSNYLRRENLAVGEYQALVLFAIVGMNLMAASNELIMIFLGLETLSISSYILLGIKRSDPKSNESALKYFLLGSFSSAFMLYGIALAYGATRTTNLELIGREILAGSASMTLIYAAVGLLFVGFGFKVAVVPFHIWTPDVYEGAPTPITAFMSAGPKAAGFAVLVRVLLVAFPAAYGKWLGLVWLSAALTMIVGNSVALVQSNIKRMLAYSSIAHAGYILVAVATRNQEGVAAVLFYTLAYALMNIGAFTVVALVSRKGDQKVHIDDFAGLGFKQPGLAAALSVFLLSLAGIPLTAGFAGKFFIFRAALESQFIWLTIIGVINSAISVYYYLRIIVVMYMQEPADDWSPVVISPSAASVIALSVLGVLQFGIFPDLLINLARISATSFR
ncbi:MAG: NADH-quinone oxidoreductase subunit N [Acidobacteria bacterium]|nr:NADH-quinone oxidoreductase subunit N [Acidobacteriota bacterium]MCI0724874.1 NADH-quinone oxidoreductase subunit N [Acidobacteriota bacterium]